MAKDTVRTLTVRGKDEGLDAVAAKLRKVGTEAKQAGAGVESFSNESAQGASRLGNLDRQLASLDKRLAGMPRAFADFEKDARLLQRGLDAGKVSAQDFARQMAELQTRLQKTISPRLGLDADQSGLRLLIDGQTQLDAATRRSVLSLVRQQEEVERMSRRAVNAINAETNALRMNTAAMNDNNRSFHTTNLLFQAQDIAMMAAMGQAPHILALQQGTQVAGIFHQIGNGKQVVEALKGAVLGLINPLSLATIATIGLGTAAFQYFTSASDGANKTEEALERHAALLKEVEKGYGLVAEKIKAASLETSAMMSFRSARSEAELRLMFQSRQRDLVAPSIWGRGGFGLMPDYESRSDTTRWNVTGEFEPFAEAIQLLRRSAEAGLPAVREFRQMVAERWGMEPNNDELRKTAEYLLENTEEALRLADAYQEARRAREAFLRNVDAAGRLRSGEWAKEDMENLRKYMVEQETAMRRMQALQDANLQQMRARSPAELEAAARAREEAIRNNEESAAARRLRIDLAGQKAREEAEFRLADAQRERIRSLNETVAAQELELALIGQTASEAARLRMEYDLTAQLREEAARNGVAADEQELALIREKAAAYGELVEQITVMQALSDLNFERSLFGLSDGDKRILSALRQMGIAADSTNGQMIAGQLRYNQVLGETEKEMKAMEAVGKDAFMSILDLLYETGDIGDKLIGIFANIGKQFAKLGMEKLWKQLSGEGASRFDAGVSAWPAMAGGGRGFAQQPSPEMKAVNDNLQQVSKSAIDVAKQFAGLNERADSKVLDSFLQASGTWRGMSSQDFAWCASFANAAIIKAGGQGTGSNAASSFLNWGQGTNNPQIGDIVVLRPQARGTTGHVGFVAGFGDGTVQIFGGNQGTPGGANTKSFGLDQVAGFRTSDVLRMGVSEGVQLGLRQTAVSNRVEMAGLGSDGFAPTGAGGGFMNMLGGNMKSLMGMAGAFAGGMQSGDPLGGAISGGLGMLGAGFGAVGIIGGAVLGLIGGLIGRARQKREELQKAQQELEQQMGAITELIATATGNFMGTFEKTVMQTADEFSKAIAMANKAKNQELVDELTAAQDEFFSRMTDRWENGFAGMLASMNAGLALDSEYMSGMDAVEKMRESLVGFINDARLFADAEGDLASVIKNRKARFQEEEKMYEYQAEYNGGRADAGALTIQNALVEGYRALGDQIIKFGVQAYTSTGAALYDTLDGLKAAAEAAGLAIDDLGVVTEAAVDPNAALADQVERAQKAAQATALAMISGAEEFTAMEEAVQKLRGTVSNMETLLTDLGMSAEDAATAIDLHLNIAMAKLRDAYRDELNASINDLSGFGFLNEIVDAMDRYEERLKDAAVLGLDASLATRELNLALADIVDTADLTQAQIDMLAEAFPAMKGLIETVAGQDAIQMVRDAEAALRSAYEEQRREIEATISRLENFTGRIKDFRNEMRLSASSPLGQRDQMEEALRQFRETAALARGEGDEAIEAQEKLTSVSQSALDEARAYYVSSERYAEIWREIDQTLADVESKAGRQLSEAQQQLEALDRQVGALIDINDSVLSVADAIAALGDAQKARDKALQDQINAAKNAGAETRTAEIAALYQSILGRAGSSSEIGWWAGTSKSMDTIRADMEWAKAHGSYATGGYTGDLARNAIAGVVHGQEFVMNAEATRRWRPQFEAMNAGHMPGNDNRALEAALRQEIGALTAEVKSLKAVVAAGANATVGAVKEGNAEMAEVSTELKRANSK